MNNQKPVPEVRFADLGLPAKLLAVLDRLKFTHPTPIQAQAIPVALQGQDVVGIAQTGTGKTLAFVLPMLQQIAARKKRGLVVVPTRELAIQVADLLQRLSGPIGLRYAVLIGGSSMGQQLKQVRQQPHVIVATPGRLIDILKQKALKLSDVGVLVLDEADRMLDMGFAPQIQQIVKQVPKDRQTMLFSATMAPEIMKIAGTHMRQPVRVEVVTPGTVADRVAQAFYVVPSDQKHRLLHKLLADYQGTVLVFSRTKHGAKRICRMVRDMGHTAAEIHSNLSLPQRRKSLEGFRSGRYRVLVATDIASRGLDVTNIELVVNYDLPESADDYVHRVGRTGRAGKAGQAVSFVAPDQRGRIRVIERLTKAVVQLSPLPVLPESVMVGPAHNRYRTQERRRARFTDRSDRRSAATSRGRKRNRAARARVHF